MFKRYANLGQLLCLLTLFLIFFGILWGLTYLTDTHYIHSYSSHTLYWSIFVAYCIGIPIILWSNSDDYYEYKTLKSSIRYSSDKTGRFSWIRIVLELILTPPVIAFIFLEPLFMICYSTVFGEEETSEVVITRLEYEKGGYRQRPKYYVYVTSKEYGDELFNSKIVYQQSYPSIILVVKRKVSKFGYIVNYNDITVKKYVGKQS